MKTLKIILIAAGVALVAIASSVIYFNSLPKEVIEKEIGVREYATTKQASAQLNSASSTIFGFCNNSGLNRIIKRIDLYLDADDGTFEEEFQTWPIVIASSTNKYATTTDYSAGLLFYEEISTSTNRQWFASSTLRGTDGTGAFATTTASMPSVEYEAWDNGDCIIGRFDHQTGNNPGKATPSSTGVVSIEYFNK